MRTHNAAPTPPSPRRGREQRNLPSPGGGGNNGTRPPPQGEGIAEPDGPSDLEVLDDGRDALSDGDAHGGEAVTRLAAGQLVHQGGDDADTARAQWVAQGDGAPIRVHSIWVEVEIVHAREDLRGERLVQLHAFQVADPQTGPRDSFARGGNRPQTHQRWVDARAGRGQDAR